MLKQIPTPQIIEFNQLPPLSLYIHLPWCIKKCPYCDFNSHELKKSLPEMNYIKALINDLELALPLIWGRSIQSIFIGGGTPSLFSGEAINYLMSTIRSLVNLSPYAEITMEVNPGTAEKQFIREYKAAGINRISLGIQSFNDKHLQILGRIHNADEASIAIAEVSNNFSNFNLDIMYGLPNQSIDQALNDISRACDFKPTHISAYNLTLEPNTHFAKFPPNSMPDNDLCFEIEQAIHSKLAQQGYARYEISAFAKPNSRAWHNLNYWQFGDYLGIGAGAHSKISTANSIIRQVRHKHPDTYMNKVNYANEHLIENNLVKIEQLPFEFMLNAMRLTDGFPMKLFNERTSLPANLILPQLLDLQSTGFIDLHKYLVIPTPHGQNFLNEMLLKFLAE